MGGDIFGFLSEEDRVIKRGHEAKPRQISKNALRIFRPRPFKIGIVKPQREMSAMLARPHPVVKRRAQIADMQMAGR